jgi:maltodextrin utilization protein YvdJ
VKPVKSSADLIQNDLKSNEIIGKYDFRDFVIDVKKTKKIKFKQGPGIVVLKQKEENNFKYTLSYRIMKIIPVKIKGQELKFVKVNDEVFAKSINTNNNSENFISKKRNEDVIPKKWNQHYGSYKAINVFKCSECMVMNFNELSLKLTEKKGLLAN